MSNSYTVSQTSQFFQSDYMKSAWLISFFVVKHQAWGSWKPDKIRACLF